MLNAVTEVNNAASTVGGEKGQNKPTSSDKREQNPSHAGKDHVMNINLCDKMMMPFVFTDVQRGKTWLFGKSNSVSFMHRWFVYYAMAR